MLRRALSTGVWSAAIGADSPGFPLAALSEAEQILRSTDVALGPADDGGFYLVATRRCRPGMFADVTWSAPDTLTQVERRLRAVGLSTARLPGWFDVDTVDGLHRLAALVAQGAVVAPATARAFAGWAEEWEVDVEDLGNVYGRPRIQSCNACVFTRRSEGKRRR
jgi:hypothetical protein